MDTKNPDARVTPGKAIGVDQMETARLALLEPCGYQLRVYNGDGEKFVVLFRRCWDRIPTDARQVIVAYWEKAGGPRNRPLFELSDCWADSAEAYAQVRLRGWELRFESESFQKLPDGVASFIIAHELAHVFYWASGGQPDASEAAREANADATAKRWGFDKVARDSFRMLVKSGGFENACRSKGWLT
jgi:hypothetical protein